jgi:hypothetical protein
MIANLNSIAAVQFEWDGVLRMRERMDQLVISTFAFDPITSPLYANIFYNLPFQLALNVLQQVLLYAKDEGLIKTSQPELDRLMESAKPVFSWVDWQALHEAVERQKELTHQGRLFCDKQCLQDISAIETQLVAWGVIAAAPKKIGNIS